MYYTLCIFRCAVSIQQVRENGKILGASYRRENTGCELSTGKYGNNSVTYSKAITLQALRVPGGSGSQILRQSAVEGGTVVSPTHRPPLPPGNIPGAHLYIYVVTLNIMLKIFSLFCSSSPNSGSPSAAPQRKRTYENLYLSS
jgi:hypothetical protein